MEIIYKNKVLQPGKLLSKYEGNIKTFLDMNILQKIPVNASFGGKLLENVSHQMKTGIKK